MSLCLCNTSVNAFELVLLCRGWLTKRKKSNTFEITISDPLFTAGFPGSCHFLFH
jgi:hypothetical protein